MKKTTIVHFKVQPYDIYIGRPGPWGNPFSHKEGTLAEFKVDSLEDCIELHKEWVLSQPELILKIKKELKGKVLGCWCKSNINNKCHGDILAKIANEDDEVLEF